MTHNICDALSHISDRHIAEAAQYQKRPLWAYLAPIASVLAVVILLSAVLNPLAVGAKAISTADYPKYHWQSRWEDMEDIQSANNAFFFASIRQILSDTGGENQAYSPVNLFMALCLLSELAQNDPQILSLLQADSAETLRQRANTVWHATYRDDGDQTLLANSVWLDKGLRYDQSVMDTLAENYYTSVYQADLQRPGTQSAIRNWINGQTGNLLREQMRTGEFSPETILALYSTVFFRAKWVDEFSPRNNKEDVFHAPDGDIPCTFMRQTMDSTYYWADDFAAVSLPLKGNSQMWIFLPDTDKTIDQVLANQQMYDIFSQRTPIENSKYMEIRLTLPKFDVRAGSDLRTDLEALGITDVFIPGGADFSAAIPQTENISISAINQATRVTIDEEGVTAASYIELPMAGAAAPPDETVDFVADRPFIFVITGNYRIPLFAGVVNNP